jgi:hypothetical protein
MRRLTLLLGAMAVVATACAQTQGTLGGGQAEEPGLAGAPQPAAVPDQPDGAALDLPALSPTVIRTANLELEVPRGEFADALDRATAVAAAYQGFVVSSSVVGEEARSGSLVLRIPAERFDAALTDLRGLGEIREQRISTDDVGEEFIDLEARKRNLEAQERVMLDLMSEAQTIAATIQIQHELEDIQLEIERIEGRLRFLEDQTALGTISLHLVEEGEVPPQPAGMFTRAWRAAVQGFVSIVAAVIVALGYLAPFALVGAIALLVWSRIRRARAGTAAPQL